jgi:multicomponent K+:H+ antiporter subunit D
LTAALYYALHSTLIGGALFLVAGLISSQRGRWRDNIEAAPVMGHAAGLGALYFVAAIAMCGLPPLSGFIGKILVLDATKTSGAMGWIWSSILGTSLVVIIGFSRAGTTVFWKSEAYEEPEEPARPTARPLPIMAASALVAGTVLLSVVGGPVTRMMETTARQLLERRPYIEAVLGGSTTAQVIPEATQ